MLNSTSKSVKRKGILFLGSPQIWEGVSSLTKVMLFQKTFAKELISAALSLTLLAEKLSDMVFENWFVVCETSGKSRGIFVIVVNGNPEQSTRKIQLKINKRTSGLTRTQNNK